MLRAKSLQSDPTIWDLTDSASPGLSVHRILQASTLEWIAIPPPGALPDPGMEPTPPAASALQAVS